MPRDLEGQLVQEMESGLEDRYETALELAGEPEWEFARPCPVPRRETVGRFPRYQNTVSSLRQPEQQKLRSIASLVRQSFRPGCQPIRVVSLVGHADRDIRRGPAFESRISLARARAVEQALKRLINSLVISSRITWQTRGVGASSVVVPNPRNEQERARNRRVEILLSRAAPNRWDHAVAENRRLARSLGWQAYASLIMRFLGFATFIPGESAFAEAVARWQGSRGLTPNGIIGAQTIARMRAALESLTSFPGDDTRPRVSSQEIPPDPGLLRKLHREFQYEAGDDADKFVTEQVFGLPEGHKLLTQLAAAGLPITTGDLDALKDGVARVDDLTKAFDAGEQRRHTLRRDKCQAVSDALSDARNHLMHLHSLVLTAPHRSRTQFGLIGEALHLIQDSYSSAHTERRWGGAIGAHRIVFIRFFGFQGSCRFPLEHRVVPPPDPRDTINSGGTLTPFARASVAASREYLDMALRHIASPGSPSIPGELRAFMDKHLALDPGHTPTTLCYPACPDPAAPCACP